MNVLIIGGSGFIGKHLTKSLLARKDRVAILSRAKKLSTPANANYEVIHWDGSDLGNVLAGRDFDAIINLAGETIGKWPWSARHKSLVMSSRTNTVEQVSKYLSLRERPVIYLQASGVGYYGDSNEVEVTEDHPHGIGFLAEVALRWEEAVKPIEALENARVCILRTGLVLSAHEGALSLLALPTQLLAGGRLGSGKQGMPWIHIDDAVGGYLHCLDTSSARGRYNLCSPDPVSNACFMQALGKATHKPVWLPAPTFALKLLLGEMSALLLEGQFAYPKRLIIEGYEFKYETLDEALENIYGKS